ncbi:hypothetical protein IWQ60_006118 [Tieghemiomyces parasiticus]|uniref:COPI associated protein n=1 Tax=Tieghemiomyces parasiticus TaxID=78921 RepID=A0A9W8ACS7_9FUNG|nr:hypothetical protein IWQ60_006118 [Tieghemiomyces parasiticus]
MANAGYVGNDTSLSWLFRLLNVVVAGLVAVAGVMFIITNGFQPIVIGVLCLAVTVLILALELSRPWFLWSKCEFLFMFLGRGILYLFLAVLILAPPLYHLIAAGIVGAIAILFCLMHFTSFEFYSRNPMAPAPVHPVVAYPAMDSRYNLPAAYV